MPARKFFIGFLLLLSQSVAAQKTIDTFKLYFDLDVAELNKNAEKKIDLLIYNDRVLNSSIITIVGYADYLCTGGYNQKLSMRRAENVKKYLLKYNLDTSNIKVCIGRGQVVRNGYTDNSGYPSDRRVDLVVNNKKMRYTEIVPKHDTGHTHKVLPPAAPNVAQIAELKKGETITLNNVYFPPGRHTVLARSVPTLEQLYEVLKNNPRLKISIEGHVCCIADGGDALDVETGEVSLSLNRAREIFTFLIDKGIDPNRLHYEGFGKSRPIVQFERTEEDASKNRRVEIRVLDN